MRKQTFPSRLIEDLTDSGVLPKIDDSKPQNLDPDANPEEKLPVNPSMQDRDLTDATPGTDAPQNEEFTRSLALARDALELACKHFEKTLEDGKGQPSEVLETISEMTEGLRAGCAAVRALMKDEGGASGAPGEQAVPSSESSLSSVPPMPRNASEPSSNSGALSYHNVMSQGGGA